MKPVGCASFDSEGSSNQTWAYGAFKESPRSVLTRSCLLSPVF